MFVRFEKLRRDEDGQTLVLAAVSMLVLALCVMATIHIGQVTYQKIELQNAADQGAYSLAATVAEGFNFFAYTNRAMICHYAGLLTLYAWVSYLLYVDHTWVRMAKLFEIVPVVGEIIGVLTQIVDKVVWALDRFVGYTAGPAINAFNYILFAFQTTMGIFLATDALAGTPTAFKKTDPNAKFNKALSGLGALARTANTVELAKAVDYKSIEALASLRSDTNEGRMVMTDLINSARHPWVAGTDVKHHIWQFLARSFAIHVSLNLFVIAASFSFRKEARTEEGATTSPRKRDQVYSVDGFKLHASASVAGGLGEVDVGFGYLSEVWADKASGGMDEALLGIDGNKWGTIAAECIVAKFIKCPKFVSRAILSPINVPWLAAVELVKGLAAEEQKTGAHHLYPLGITPYMKFKPEAKWRAGFNEPDFMVVASKDMKEVNKIWTSSKIPLKYHFDPMHDGGKTVDFLDKDQGMPSWLSPGLNAIAVARTYYHRPGDWREQPNFFNPFWGAKLEPVASHPIFQTASLGGIVRKLIAH